MLYQADWSSGLNGWAGPSSWKTVAGQLVTDGSNSSNILAPYQPTPPNYAIEAQIQVAQHPVCGGWWGIVARLTQTGYYTFKQGWGGCGVGDELDWVDTSSGGNNTNTIMGASGPPDPGTSWHIYRLEVKDNVLTLKIDGSMIMTVSDNHDLDPGQVGLFAGDGAQLNVQSFKVIAL